MKRLICLLLAAVLCLAGCAGQPGQTVSVTFRQEGYVDVVKTIPKGAELTDIPSPVQVKGYQTVVWDRTDFSAVTEDTVVTAIMQPMQYNVRLELSGGTVIESSLPVENDTFVIEYKSDYELPRVEKEGCVFDGWYSDGLYISKKGIWEYTYVETLTARWISGEREITDLVDFAVEVESGRDVVILQLTDTQIIDAGQARTMERLGNKNPLTEQAKYTNCYRYIEDAVKKTNPDLILMTGDLIYGEFDDSGEIFKGLIAYMESLNIPWAPVFGNHDNESMMGVTWQCEQLEQAENCLFKRNNLTGNGNYSIGIVQDGQLIETIFMMDSNGCTHAFADGYGALNEAGQPLTYNAGEKIKTEIGFGADQVEWLEESCKNMDAATGGTVGKLLAFHIPISQFAAGAYESGYQSDQGLSNAELYTIGEDVTAQNGDFGTKGEAFKGIHSEYGLWNILKKYNFEGVFCGHSHKNSVSILYDGIRLTFGLKAGTFDRYLESELGGTKITVSKNLFEVEHVYYNK